MANRDATAVAGPDRATAEPRFGALLRIRELNVLGKLVLAAAVGLMPKMFDGVIRSGRMDCPFYQTFFKYVLERDSFAAPVAAGHGTDYVPTLSDFVAAANGVSLTER